MPSSKALSFGPWLSPAVRKRNSDISVPSDGGPHDFHRRRLPGPQLESPRALVDQHAQAVNRLGAGLSGQAQKGSEPARPVACARGIDEVVSDLARPEGDAGVPGQGIGRW